MELQLNRFNAWAALLVASIISAAALEDEGQWKNIGKKGTFAISCCAVSALFSLLVVLGHYSTAMKTIIVGTYLELFLSVVLLCLWCGGISFIQDPRNALATFTGLTKGNDIKNANLYFFSWASFGTSMYLATSNLQQTSPIHLMDRISNAPKKLLRWYMLFSSSIIILVTAADLQGGACSDVCYGNINGCYQAKSCRATKFAISIGAIIGLASLVSIILSHFGSLQLIGEFFLSVLSLIFYSFGVGFITADEGPGSSLGNLYFATWAGFIFSMMIVVMCASEYLYNSDDTVIESSPIPNEQPDDDHDVEIPPKNNNNNDDIDPKDHKDNDPEL